MTIGKIVGSNFVKSAVNFAKKNPLIWAGGIGVAGLVTYKAVTNTRKQNLDAMNFMLLTNPFLNPMGWSIHAINPNAPINGLDRLSIASCMVEKNNKEYQKYYENLSPQERIREYYKNGGKGVTFDNVA